MSEYARSCVVGCLTWAILALGLAVVVDGIRRLIVGACDNPGVDIAAGVLIIILALAIGAK
ncbi:MAG TPA: hypothetical protein EYH32_10185 [Anaerolineae bacterium]|nr:hypothetical protein [Anaerolineae bacterium]